MIAALKAAYKAWRIARLESTRKWHIEMAEDHREDAALIAIQAYHVDMMQFPMRWARLHNQVLWASHNEKLHRQAARRIEAELKELS